VCAPGVGHGKARSGGVERKGGSRVKTSDKRRPPSLHLLSSRPKRLTPFTARLSPHACPGPGPAAGPVARVTRHSARSAWTGRPRRPQRRGRPALGLVGVVGPARLRRHPRPPFPLSRLPPRPPPRPPPHKPPGRTCLCLPWQAPRRSRQPPGRPRRLPLEGGPARARSRPSPHPHPHPLRRARPCAGGRPSPCARVRVVEVRVGDRPRLRRQARTRRP